MGTTSNRKPSICFIWMLMLEFVVLSMSYEESRATYGFNNEFSQQQQLQVQSQRAWRVRGRKGGRGNGGRGQLQLHHQNKNGASRRNRIGGFEWEREEVRQQTGRFRPSNKRILTTPNPNKENFITMESVEACCPTIFEMVEPVAGKNRTGHLVELYRDSNVRQRFYEVSCRPGIVNKPCKFLENRFSKTSTCIQQFSFTYALVRPPVPMTRGEHPWSLDYISIRSGCACQVVASRRRKKQRGEF